MTTSRAYEIRKGFSRCFLSFLIDEDEETG